MLIASAAGDIEYLTNKDISVFWDVQTTGILAKIILNGWK
jgi:hypothetical protein